MAWCLSAIRLRRPVHCRLTEPFSGVLGEDDCGERGIVGDETGDGSTGERANGCVSVRGVGGSSNWLGWLGCAWVFIGTTPGEGDVLRDRGVGGVAG